MRAQVSRFLSEEEGQSLVEYGLLISLIALVAVVAVTLFGKRVEGNWNSSTGKLSNAFETHATP